MTNQAAETAAVIVVHNSGRVIRKARKNRYFVASFRPMAG